MPLSSRISLSSVISDSESAANSGINTAAGFMEDMMRRSNVRQAKEKLKTAAQSSQGTDAIEDVAKYMPQELNAFLSDETVLTALGINGGRGGGK